MTQCGAMHAAEVKSLSRLRIQFYSIPPLIARAVEPRLPAAAQGCRIGGIMAQ